MTSTACWTAMAILLAYLSFAIGPAQMFKLYGIPYLVGQVIPYLSSFKFYMIQNFSDSNLLFGMIYHLVDFRDMDGFRDLPTSPWP